MTGVMPTLTDAELSRYAIVDEEAGFGALTTVNGPLPLKAMDVRARIDGLLAEVALEQTFVNTYGDPLEATYIFPLPDRAAVTRFRLEVAGRVVEGILKERGQARQDYDQAIQAGQRAAITEEERPGVFTMRVGNLMPGETATVSLSLVGPLAYSDGEATFRFPLVVAPRYIPGVPLDGPAVGAGTQWDTDAVPDASRISPPVLLPGYPNPVRLSITVDVLPSDLPLRDFRSALHAVLETVADSGVRRIFVQPGERVDRDFVLRFRTAEEAVHTSLALTPDADDPKKGTFALTVVPPEVSASSQRPRDVVFVLDRSGSMGGWKMVAARRALARMVDTLTERDRFAVYAFDNEVVKPPHFPDLSLQAATDRNRFRAVEFLGTVEARGGTEMAQPLTLAAHQLSGSTRPSDRVLVLITDGQVGNEDQILRALAPEMRKVRVFALGIDKAVNAGFLRRLADLGGGACELVESEERLDEVLEQVHRRIGTPVLTGLRVEPSGFTVEAESVVPRRLPDLFAGAPLFVLGRYQGGLEGSLRLSAAADSKAWSQTVAARVGGNGAVPATWARGHIRDLEDRFVTSEGNHAALEKRIIDTSLRFGVLCRFTAFVAVDRSEVVNEGGKLREVVQPVELPAGWQMELEGVAQSCLSIDPKARKRTMLARQVPDERNSRGRVSKRTQLAPEAMEKLVARRDENTPHSPSAPPPSSPGSPGQSFGKMRSSEPTPAPPEREERARRKKRLTSPDELVAHRRRAVDLLTQVRAALALTAIERLEQLGGLTNELSTLIEDLKSIKVAVATLMRLEKLLAELRQQLAQDRPQDDEVVRILRSCELCITHISRV